MLRITTATELFPDIYDAPIRIGKLQRVFGHPKNIKTLIFLCCLARAGHAPFLEFGTFTGRTTYNVALNSPGKHYTVDVGEELGATLDRSNNLTNAAYPPYVAGENFIEDAEVASDIELLIGNSKEIDLSALRAKMGLIWVDAGHSYEQAMNDSAKAFEAVKPGGIIVWHDYVDYWPGVKRAIDELAQSRDMFWLQDEEVVVFRNL